MGAAESCALFVDYCRLAIVYWGVARRRFIADEVQGATAALIGQNAAHLTRVLRARVGQEYEIAADGVVRLGKVTVVGKDRVEFELGEEIGSAGVNRPFPKEGKDRVPIAVKDGAPVTLILAIFKFDRFEWAVEKATELGVARIVPVIARRTDAHLAQAAPKRVERWRRIAHEASQQSRRVEVPEIDDAVKVKEAVGIEAGLKILLDETEQERRLRDVVEEGWSRATAVHNTTGSVALAVGPEGGWTEDEIQLFAAKGWISATLGATILRAETAVVAGVAVVTSF